MEQAYATFQSQLRAEAQVGAYTVEMRRNPDAGLLLLLTPVFHGGNFIPKSVRTALNQSGLMAVDGRSEAALLIDEEKFQVLFCYRTQWKEGDQAAFSSLMEEFLSLADEWHHVLEDFGDRDLIHVPL